MAETAKKKVYTPIKMVKVQERRHQRNMSVKTRVKNTFKAALQDLNALAIEEKKAPETSEKAIATAKKAYSTIDKAVAKGVVHKNKAARRKSRLAKKLNAAMVAEAKA